MTFEDLRAQVLQRITKSDDKPQLIAALRESRTLVGETKLRGGPRRNPSTGLSSQAKWLKLAPELVEKWNNPPYPTMKELGQEYGVVRERVRQWLRNARRHGFTVLTPQERTQKKRTERKEQAEATKPHCSGCGKAMNRQTMLHPDGNRYCVKCRYRHCPHCRERQNRSTERRHKERMETETEYRKRFREYHRNYSRRRKGGGNGCCETTTDTQPRQT